VPGQRLGVGQRDEGVEDQAQLVGPPRHLGRATVRDLETEDDPLAVVVPPVQLRGGHLRGERCRDADLGAREVGGLGVLLGRDGLDEHAAAVGQLEDRRETGTEPRVGARLGGHAGTGERRDPVADGAREIGPAKSLATEGERRGAGVVGTHGPIVPASFVESSA
jgi:hypothetical protein